jgi:hypothetical protein
MKKVAVRRVVLGLLVGLVVVFVGCSSAPVNKSITQWSALPKELSVEVVKAPEVTMSDEAVSKLKAAIAEEFEKDGWIVKESPLRLRLTITAYNEGSATKRTTMILLFGFTGGAGSAEIGADAHVMRGADILKEAPINVSKFTLDKTRVIFAKKTVELLDGQLN